MHLDHESAKMLCSGDNACVKAQLNALAEEHFSADVREDAWAAYTDLDAL